MAKIWLVVAEIFSFQYRQSGVHRIYWNVTEDILDVTEDILDVAKLIFQDRAECGNMGTSFSDLRRFH
jgi:hypothetical protein